MGRTIWEYANGIDNSEVKANDNEKPKGIGNSVTLSKDEKDLDKLSEVLLALCEQVTYRLRKHNMEADVVNVQIKNNEFQVYSHQRKLKSKTSSTKIIFEMARKLLYELYNSTTNKNVRLIGIRVDTVSNEENEQMTLFSEKNNAEADEKQKKVDETIDYLKEKYGYNMVTRAGKMNIGKMIRLKD